MSEPELTDKTEIPAVSAPRTEANTGRNDPLVEADRAKVSGDVMRTLQGTPYHYHGILRAGFCDREKMTRCSLSDLIRYAAQARSVKDWVNVVAIQEAIIERSPDDTRGVFFLVIALENMHDVPGLERALELRRTVLGTNGVDPENDSRMAELERRIAYLKGDTPDSVSRRERSAKSYRDVKEEDLNGYGTRELIHLSMDAQSAQAWETVVIVQTEIIRRQPENITSHVVLCMALENTGRYAEALREWEAVVALPGYERHPWDTQRDARLRAKVAGTWQPERNTFYQRRRPRFDLPSSHREVTTDILRQCTPADLERYARQAGRDGDGERAGMFRAELERRGATFERRAPSHVCPHHQTPRQHTARVDSRLRAAEFLPNLDPRPASPSATTSAPAAEGKPANLDISRFDNFLASLRREAESWPQVKGQGEGWRQVREVDREFLVEAFTGFRAQLSRRIATSPHRAFWGKFDDMEIQIHRGSINLHAVDTLIERTAGAARGADIDLSELEPVHLKTRR